MAELQNQKRWAHLTYASFQSASGGGWQIGDAVGATAADEELARNYSISALETLQPIDDFAKAKEIAELPRRCDYHIDAGQGVFVHALPAGKDATRRPGNVFNHIVVDHLPAQPAAGYPIQWYRSEDLLQPFGHRAVNDARLPKSVGEPVTSDIGDIFAAWMMVRNMGEDRVGAIYQLQNLLADDGPHLAILLTETTDEAATWITAVSSTLSRDIAAQFLEFSTFMRASELAPLQDGNGPTIVAVPRYDAAAIPSSLRARVVDPADMATWGQPQCDWARSVAEALEAGADETALSEHTSVPTSWVPAEVPLSTRLAGRSGAQLLTDQLVDSSAELMDTLHLADQLLQAGELESHELSLLDEHLFSRDGIPTTALSLLAEEPVGPTEFATSAMRRKFAQLTADAKLALFLLLSKEGDRIDDESYWMSRQPVIDMGKLSFAELSRHAVTRRILSSRESHNNAILHAWLLYLHPELPDRRPVIELLQSLIDLQKVDGVNVVNNLRELGAQAARLPWFPRYCDLGRIRRVALGDKLNTTDIRLLLTGSQTADGHHRSAVSQPRKSQPRKGGHHGYHD
ncbi:GAP1-N2 domain-containing protein [Corynebacterium cystitidis]|uniref:GAP1-N2 domain-containing protein n=1 Tax=Corynebacterium cystitidis TaxID=35757 RepID=UPI00211E18BC|nr:hypothetical protein [Corynebacterium cystitidis]